jgi:hypothetical protein
MYGCMHAAGVKNGGKAFVGIIIPCSTPGCRLLAASAARPPAHMGRVGTMASRQCDTIQSAVSTEQHVSLCSWIAFWRWSSRRPYVQVSQRLAVWAPR